MASTTSTQNLPPVPTAVTITVDGQVVNNTWNQWFVQLQQKVNLINARLAATSTSTAILTPGTYGSTTQVPEITVDQYGNITAITQVVPASASPLTTKGDLYTYSTTNTRLPVGTNGYVLSASSSQPTGLQWVPAATPTLPVTTKGDILGYDTAPNRIPIGSDGYVLTADSTQSLGLGWKAPTGSGSTYIVPAFSSVSSLLHFNGTNGSTTFTDQVAGNTWIANNATISTTQSLFGGASGLFTGSSFSNIALPTNSGFNVGSNNWTLEFAIYVNGSHQTSARIFQTGDGDIYAGISLTINASTAQGVQLYLSSTGSSFDILNGGNICTLPTGVWTRLLIQRSGNALQAFMNGSLTYIAQISGSIYYNSTDTVIVGGNKTTTSRSINAYLDEFRFTKGVSLLQSYLLSTSEFPNS
jgi:hypothetical protein